MTPSQGRVSLVGRDLKTSERGVLFMADWRALAAGACPHVACLAENKLHQNGIRLQISPMKNPKACRPHTMSL